MEVLTKERKKRNRIIPSYLICEELEGKPLYYKDYKTVLSGKKNKEDIISASGLQMEIISFLIRLLLKKLDEKKYRVYGGETGLHLAYRSNLSADVCVYEKSILTPDNMTTKYLDISSNL